MQDSKENNIEVEELLTPEEKAEADAELLARLEKLVEEAKARRYTRINLFSPHQTEETEAFVLARGLKGDAVKEIIGLAPVRKMPPALPEWATKEYDFSEYDSAGRLVGEPVIREVVFGPNMASRATTRRLAKELRRGIEQRRKRLRRIGFKPAPMATEIRHELKKEAGTLYGSE